MADHKAPTSVTIASTEEETAFSAFVRQYWKMGLGILVAISAGVLFRQWRQTEATKAVDASWARLGEVVNFEGIIQPESAGVLADMAAELQDKDAGPWAKAIEAGARVKDGDWQGAEAALAELEAGWPDHDLVTRVRSLGGGKSATLPQALRTRIQALQAFEDGLTGLESNPELPEGSPRVRLETSAGSIVLGLYAEKAPRHVENFLKHCREGYYDGTRFHRVIADFMIQGGDPNSKDEEAKDSWGQGGPGYTVPAEITELKHFTYVLAAAKNPSEVDSSGSQFYITVADRHDLDGVHTVYGVVLEGADVCDTIAAGAVTGDRPDEPVLLQSTAVL